MRGTDPLISVWTEWSWSVPRTLALLQADRLALLRGGAGGVEDAHDDEVVF